ncbi:MULTISPECIES: hypothetical protein [unclassified Streptomyces]|uniref:hypothetical protein n=1 Tax=unclassified Streptomyces TaxID=2593676 RepID=UPI0004BD6184|nr:MULTISPECIES: hypothetical protein [unclassified Streptomyces]
MFVVVAVLLLPLAGVTLAALSWWEERLFTTPETPRHARTPHHRRHLRLIPGGRTAHDRTAPAEQRDAA